MSEWHLTPEYILNNWTDEKFNLMVEKLVERKQQKPASPIDNKVSVETLVAQSHGLIEVKHGN